MNLDQATAVIDMMNTIALHQCNRKIDGDKIVERGMFEQGHPLTCGNDSNHPVLMPMFVNNKIYLICPECNWTQDSANIFSLDLS